MGIFHWLRWRRPGDRATNGGSPRLIEHLDNVLSTLCPASLAYCRHLRQLRVESGNQKILPQSHILPISLLSTTEWPIASRGPCDMYDGWFDGSKVCVKRLRVYSNGEPEMAKIAFFQEAVVWRRLEHPNIVPFLGVTVTPLQSVSVWMPGGELLEYINAHPSVDRLGFVSDVVCGLNYLHSHSIVHGDLKGPSILVDGTGHARLTDFGLAIVAPEFGPAEPFTEGHAVRWAAPEILDRERPASKQSDMFSFGMVVVEIFTGQVPFPDVRPTTVAVGVLSGNRPERPANPNLTDDFWGLTERCWDQDPQRRPDILEVAHFLQTALRYGDSETPDDTTLGSFRQKEPSPAPRHEGSRSSPAFCGLGRLPKYPVSRSTRDMDATYNPESEGDGKSVDTRRESFSGSKTAGRKSCWNPPTNYRRNRPSSSLGKRGTSVVAARDSVFGSNRCVDRRRRNLKWSAM